jgi:hypothetical protein
VNRAILKHAALFAGLIALAVGTRLAMVAPNLHAVTGAALFAGFYFRNRFTAACVPLVAMFASDWVIGGYSPEVMATVYASLLLPIAFRGWLRLRLTAPRVLLSSVVSSLVFFLATNAAVWHANGWYTPGWQGLAACYTAALPFFFNSLGGDVAFSCLLFGAYALATQREKLASHELATAT